MIRAVRTLVALGAICTLAFPASAASVASPTNFRFTTPVPLTFVQTTPYVVFFFTQPIETVVPRVGRASVKVDFSTCSPFPCEPTGVALLFVRVTTSGGTLLLSGGTDSAAIPSTGTWTVTEATGRFEGYTGAGTYTWNWTSNPPPFGSATLSLVGQLGREVAG